MKSVKIDLFSLDKSDFFKTARKKFPDENVKFLSDGTSVIAEISDNVPLQLQVDIQDFLQDFARETSIVVN